jgi:uncharacterized protein YkwD
VACTAFTGMSRIVAILLFSLSLLLGSFHEGYAGKYAPSDEETVLLELINEARKDPLAMAASLGMDPEAVLRDLPELVDVLTAGLPPLNHDQRLYEAALGHTTEMVAHPYYAHASLDGRTYAERIRETGYAPAGCGESLGMVAFQNLMAPEEAVRIIFESIFLAELDPGTTKARNILNPDWTEAGIALGSGQFTRDGSVLNAYVATLDFGKPVVDMEAVERALLAVINTARKDPALALLNAGIDPIKAAEIYGKRGWDLTDPLPPLAWNERLNKTAAAHNRDMRDRNYFSTFSLDGLTPLDRVTAAGYDPVHVGESLGILWVGKGAPEDAGALAMARRLYAQMLKIDADPDSGADRNLFSPSVTEVGIGVAAIFQDGDGQPIGYAVVADFARPRDERSFVVGTVYEDRNHNGLMDDDEGTPGMKIIANPGYSGMWQTVTAQSGPMGHYQMDLSSFLPGWTKLYVEQDEIVMGPFFVAVERGVNVLKDIKIEPESTVDAAGSTQYDEKRLDRSLRICY